MFEAVERNDLSAVRATVADGARIEARSSFGMRPVDLAIDKGHYEIAHYLLSLHNVREAANAAASEGPAVSVLPEAADRGAPAIADTSPQPIPPPPPSAEPPPPPDISISSDREDDRAVKPAEPAAPPAAGPPPPSTPSQPEMTTVAPVDTDPAGTKSAAAGGFLDKASARVRRVAHSFDETFDTFLGGWFFRWMGRKMARTDQPQAARDGTLAVADLTMPSGDAVPPAGTPETDPPPASESTAGPVDAIPPPAAMPAVAPPAEMTEPVVTASVAEKDAPPAEAVAAPEPNVPPATGASETPVDEPPVRPLPTVAVATRKIPDSPPPTATMAARTLPSTPPLTAPAAPPPVARQPAGPVPPVVTMADPFAPDTVAPGTRHPIIGEKPPAPPPIPLAERPAERLDVPSPPSPERAAAPARPAVSGRPSPARNKAGPTPIANPAGPLDQLAETPKSSRPAALTSKEDLPLGLDGPNAAPMRTAMASAPAPGRKVPDSVLTLGSSIYITTAMPPEPADPSERNFCVKKSRGAVVFCVEPVDWPAKLARQLRVNSVMYQGAQAIVRYDDGLATRIQAIFPTDSHDALVAYYSQRFGKPTAASEHAITPFAQPRQSNQVVSWQVTDPLSHEKTTLEIRRYDDTRGGFPDMRYGAILLYNVASPPIFPVLSTLDLMPTSAQ
ncbi:hypothetical protein [Shumkonia mesophila]|uniref:hypothetical protein n=1 Tax=Shumkonia mesophila TaxID=2838854 RepID=UPI002934D52B|nr:hypothetical protein [Shumkonia mesophila]